MSKGGLTYSFKKNDFLNVFIEIENLTEREIKKIENYITRNKGTKQFSGFIVNNAYIEFNKETKRAKFITKRQFMDNNKLFFSQLQD